MSNFSNLGSSTVMLILDGGSTSIANFLPSPRPAIPSPLTKLWTAAYSQIAPGAVLEWHKSFLEAGADIITTNTYQIPLSKDLPDADLPSIVHKAVSLALEAVQSHGKGSVALSFGTRNAQFGKSEYSTEAQASMEEYREYHREKLAEFYMATRKELKHIEYFAFETLSSFEEASAVLEILAQTHFTVGKKAWVTFSCGDASISRMEGIIEQVLQSQHILRLWGIGFNCVGIDIVKDLTEMLAKKINGTHLRMVVYPDAGRCHDRTTAQFTQATEPVGDADVQEWAETLAQVGNLNEGKVVLGGCCNTDSRHISALAKVL